MTPALRLADGRGKRNKILGRASTRVGTGLRPVHARGKAPCPHKLQMMKCRWRAP
jgi:hypothetical protein